LTSVSMFLFMFIFTMLDLQNGQGLVHGNGQGHGNRLGHSKIRISDIGKSLIRYPT
jgi:hypothetical protein